VVERLLDRILVPPDFQRRHQFDLIVIVLGSATVTDDPRTVPMPTF